MGYYTAVTGEINFSRELSHEHLAKVKDLGNFEQAEVDGIYFDGDAWKAYGLEDDARSLVGVLAEYGVTATGTIECVGEEQPDIWRLVFKDGTVVHEEIKMVWPDGTEYRG